MFSKSKRIVGIVLAALMVASVFAGCGDNNSSSTPASGSGDASGTSSQQQIKNITVDEMMADAQVAMGDAAHHARSRHRSGMRSHRGIRHAFHRGDPQRGFQIPAVFRRRPLGESRRARLLRLSFERLS